MEFEQLVKPVIVITVVILLIVAGMPVINKLKDSFLSLFGLEDEIKNKLADAIKVYEQNPTSENALAVAKLYVQKGGDVDYKNAEEWFLDKVLKDNSTNDQTGEEIIKFIESSYNYLYEAGTKIKEFGTDASAAKIRVLTDIKIKWPESEDRANFIMAGEFLKTDPPQYSLAVKWYDPIRYDNKYYQQRAAQKTLVVYKEWLDPFYQEAIKRWGSEKDLMDHREDIKNIVRFFKKYGGEFNLKNNINWNCTKLVSTCNIAVETLDINCYYQPKQLIRSQLYGCLSCTDFEGTDCTWYNNKASCESDPCSIGDCHWGEEGCYVYGLQAFNYWDIDVS